MRPSVPFPSPAANTCSNRHLPLGTEPHLGGIFEMGKGLQLSQRLWNNAVFNCQRPGKLDTLQYLGQSQLLNVLSDSRSLV